MIIEIERLRRVLGEVENKMIAYREVESKMKVLAADKERGELHNRDLGRELTEVKKKYIELEGKFGRFMNEFDQIKGVYDRLMVVN
jgi:septation ring formation regulator EzrA